jgi:hypothetical protein
MSQSAEKTVLFDKIYASNLGGAIGDAMGNPVKTANPDPNMRALWLSLAEVAVCRHRKTQAVLGTVDQLL